MGKIADRHKMEGGKGERVCRRQLSYGITCTLSAHSIYHQKNIYIIRGNGCVLDTECLGRRQRIGVHYTRITRRAEGVQVTRDEGTLEADRWVA